MLKFFLRVVFICFAAKSFALTPVSVALDWYINPDHAPILAAQTMGYFKKNGLEVTLIQPTQTSEVRDLVVTNQATIGIDYEPETLIAISKGLPLAMVGNLIPTPLSCIATLQSSEIKTLADLNGKILGYSGDPTEKAFLEVELQHAGVNPNSMNLLPIQMDLTQALLAHTVDAVNGMMRNVEPVLLQSRDIPTRLFYPEQNGIPTYSELVFIARTDANPQTIQAFLTVVGEGAKYVQEHPEDSWQAVAQNKAYHDVLATSRQIADENRVIWLTTVPYFTTNPADMNQAEIAKFKAFLQENGLL